MEKKCEHKTMNYRIEHKYSIAYCTKCKKDLFRVKIREGYDNF